MTIEMRMVVMKNNQALIEYLLRLGDTDMVLAQRFCEWCGNAPALEEEMAMMIYYMYVE